MSEMWLDLRFLFFPHPIIMKTLNFWRRAIAKYVVLNRSFSVTWVEVPILRNSTNSHYRTSLHASSHYLQSRSVTTGSEDTN